MKRVPSWVGALALLLVIEGHSQTTGPPYSKTTVEQIIKMGKRIDGKRVEVRGTILAGNETDIFRDESTCKGLKVAGCTVWLKYQNCAVVRDPTPTKDCGEDLVRLYQQHGDSTQPSVLKISHVVVRGIASTFRKDVKYDKSVPQSARLGGFGHLGAYPAQITVEELAFPESR